MATDTIKWSNAHLKSGVAALKSFDTSTKKAMFGMVRDFALAYHEKAFNDRQQFIAVVESARAKDGRPTVMEGNRASERWSIVKLGAYDAAPAIFKAMEPLEPSLTAMYDLTCGIRGTGSFKGHDAALNLKEKDAAPTTADLQKVMRAASVIRNASNTSGRDSNKADFRTKLQRAQKMIAKEGTDRGDDALTTIANTITRWLTAHTATKADKAKANGKAKARRKAA